MAKFRAYFYCDLSKNTGLGHFRRLSFITEHVRRQFRGECIFLVEPSKGFASHQRLIFQETKCRVISFESRKQNSWKRLKPAQLLIIDSYLISPLDLKTWRKFFKSTFVVIDDLERGFNNADIVISPNVLQPGSAPSVQKKNGQVILRGEKYFTLNQTCVSHNRSKRKLRSQLRNILVSIGGNPKKDVIDKILRNLKRSSKNKLNCRIMLGPFGSAPASSFNQKLITELHCQFIRNMSNIKQLLWADIAVISGGVTKYETTALGTPCFILTQHRAQIPFVRSFMSRKTAISMGIADIFSEHSFQKKFSYMNQYRIRRDLSKRSKRLIDGRGFERILPWLRICLRKNKAEKGV